MDNLKANLGEFRHLLQGQLVSTPGGAFDPNVSKKAKQDRYYSLMRGINMYSFSTSGTFVACPRKLAISKLEQAAAFDRDATAFSTLAGNIHFAFGKCMESGVQAYFMKKNKAEIFMAMFMAWDLPLNQLDPNDQKKTFVDACILMDRITWILDAKFADWELAFFNGKPAIELSFLINLGNGYHYAGHADLILFHKFEHRYRVMELKTTNRKWVHPAIYKNMDQGVGYSVVLDSIATDLELTATFEVFYLIMMSVMEKAEIFEFTKSRSNRANWLNTILLDTHTIEMYRKTGVWPKRGNSCFDYNKQCQYYDTCDMAFENFNPTGEFSVLSDEEINEHSFDFRFDLKDIIDTQTELI